MLHWSHRMGRTRNLAGKAFASRSLLQAGLTAKAAVPSLIAELQDADENNRQTAAYVLGEFGVDAKSAVPSLIDCLGFSPEKSTVPNAAASALSKIAASARDHQDTSLVQPLERAEKALISAKFTKEAKEVAAAVRLLNSMQSNWSRDDPFAFVDHHPYLTCFLLYVLYALGCVFLYIVRPLTIWKFNESFATFLRHWHVEVGETLVTVLFVIGWFRYRDRVLDAWVLKKLPLVDENFKRLPTVAESIDRIPGLPVLFGANKKGQVLKSSSLKDAFNAKGTYLLLHGEGGLGKTTIACEIAEWVMSKDERDRPCRKPMLPVLIEESFRFGEVGGKSILEIIQGKLRMLVEESEEVPEELVRRLLRKQRILVIIDGLSEMNEYSRQSILPDSPDFDPNALLITSRFDHELATVEKTIIRPERIPPEDLTRFIHSYLSKHGAGVTFGDEELLEAPLTLKRIVHEKPITVLLAKQFAQRMIDKKAGREDEMAGDVPDLMLGYLNHLNRHSVGGQSSGIEDREVHRIAKIAAWECVKDGLRPGSADYQSLVSALGLEDGARQVKRLSENLRLLQVAGPGRNLVKFNLDPLAEYLAALYLVETNGSTRTLWQEFVAKATRAVSSGRSSGFLLAVCDCCVSKGPVMVYRALWLMNLTCS